MHVPIRLLPLICMCPWVLNSMPQENGSKLNEKIFYHHCFYKTSAFLENMLIFMCWHKKNHLPPNMKHFNAVKLFCFGFVPRKYFWGLYIEFSRAFPFRSNRIDAEMIAGLLCSANICCAVCWRQRGGNHSWTISVGEPWCCSSHFRCTAIYSVSELALERLQLLGSHLGSQQTGILPTVGTKGTAEPTSLFNKCIHQAQSCKAMIKYCTFCLYSGNNITPHSAFPLF